MIDQSFWKDKRVLITGHTGFKGAWLSLWLHSLGAKVVGYALQPPTEPSLLEACRLNSLITSIQGDIRSRDKLEEAVLASKPEIVIHMAAQPLVRASYQTPVETYEVNVLGTVNLLEAVRQAVYSGIAVKAVILVTTDKCYENREWVWGYREGDRLGGYDPYSNSKACAELVAAAYRQSFFHPDAYTKHGVALATVRAGNVIGGGDWAADRLIPDMIRALGNGTKVKIRYPDSVRPWQHVLEPLAGYLRLAELMIANPEFGQSYNFGPDVEDARSVVSIVHSLCEKWGEPAAYEIERDEQWHEAHYLKLDCTKARSWLGWRPIWTVDQALDRIVEWFRCYRSGADMSEVCLRQIEAYQRDSLKRRERK